MSKYLIGVLCFLFALNAMSQEKVEKDKDTILTENLDEVILTATRTVRQLSSLPMPAQLISKSEIKSINSLRLSDLLVEQSGLITVPDFGGGEGIQLQGLDSQYTLVLIDGLPLIGRSAGTLDLNRISIGNVKQIEIVKGASSSLYGSEALGGVVNIITEKPRYGWHGSVKHRNGTFNTQDSGLDLGFRNENFNISTFINRNSSDGYKLIEESESNTVEPFTNYTLDTRANYTLSDKTKLTGSLRYFTSDQDYVISQDVRGDSNIDEWNSSLRADHKFNDRWASELELYFTNYQANAFLNDDLGNQIEDSDFNQTLFRPELRTIFSASEKTEFVGGVGMNHEVLRRTDFSENPIFNAPYVFLQYDGRPVDKLNLIVGARFDAHNEYESQLSPKAALHYEFNEKWSSRFAVGYGFKAPDFRQLYFDFTNATVGYTVLGFNAAVEAIQELQEQGEVNNIFVPIDELGGQLNPENSVSYNLGADFKPNNKLKLGINFFRNDIDDLIDTRVIASKTNGQNIFSYYNVSRVFTQGLEFNASFKLNKRLKLSGGYQLLYAYDKDARDAFENGEVFARPNPSSPSFRLEKSDYFGLFNRSRHMANFKVFYDIPKWGINANLRATYRSKFGLTDSNGNTYLDRYDEFVDGYSIWDLAINKDILNNYRVAVGVDNMFDFNDPQNISNIPGRIIYGQINISF